MTPVTFPELAEKPARSRTPRVHTLPVAEIFSVLNAERMGNEAVVTVIIGDDRNPTKRHGLRAPRARWLQLISTLVAEDPAIGDALRDLLQVRPQVSGFKSQPSPPCPGCDNHGCPDCTRKTSNLKLET